MIISVSTHQGLLSALRTAQSGDRIEVASGDYSMLTLNGVRVAGEVTITSADPNAPAVIHGVDIDNSSGLTFTNLEIVFETRLGGAVAVYTSNNIKFDHVEIAGSPDNRIGNGVVVSSSTNVTISNSDIHDFAAGIAHGKSEHITFANNAIHDITIDGIRGGGSNYVTVTGNYFTDFHQIQYAHNDAIQFWTSNTTTTTHDLVITNNTFVRGSGDVLQGVFMNNEAGIPYENVTITGNAIIGGAYHGITVEKAIGLTVEDNLIQGYKDMGSPGSRSKTPPTSPSKTTTPPPSSSPATPTSPTPQTPSSQPQTSATLPASRLGRTRLRLRRMWASWAAAPAPATLFRRRRLLPS